MLKVISALIAVAVVGCAIVLKYLYYDAPDIPLLNHAKMWGPKSQQEDISIRPFVIDFNATMIKDLKQRLRNIRPLTKPLQGVQSEYGINTVYLQKVINYWIEKYDFKKRADLLNKFTHYKTKIQGLDTHFIWSKPNVTGVKVLPLLILHGWPSSSKEFDKIIPILTTPKEDYDFVFEVIAVDLPGFGFSEGTNKPGFNTVQIAILLKNLMARLGHKKFFIQGGDWGSQCGVHMATLFPADILGFHTNMPLSSMTKSHMKSFLAAMFPTLVDPKHPERVHPLHVNPNYLFRETGYFHIQATKPDTIGVALTDSPAGMAAYIIEKMGFCSHNEQTNTPHAGIENLNLDDVLDTITIMWANNRVVTSMRIYAENFNTQWPEVKIIHNIPTPVPTAVIKFLHEVVYQPDWILKDKYINLIRSTTHNFGGHFAALQTPLVLAEDIFKSTVAFLQFHEKHKKKIK